MILAFSTKYILGIWDGGSSILILDMLKNYPDAAYLGM